MLHYRFSAIWVVNHFKSSNRLADILPIKELTNYVRERALRNERWLPSLSKKRAARTCILDLWSLYVDSRRVWWKMKRFGMPWRWLTWICKLLFLSYFFLILSNALETCNAVVSFFGNYIFSLFKKLNFQHKKSIFINGKAPTIVASVYSAKINVLFLTAKAVGSACVWTVAYWDWWNHSFRINKSLGWVPSTCDLLPFKGCQEVSVVAVMPRFYRL